ncbi:MAG: VanZ family protein [Ruminococcaceae bacterium]|nr:VanZ family protein [Oscillospiraceae bacterium]
MKRKVIVSLSWVMVAAVCATIFSFSSNAADDSAAQSGWLRALFEQLFGVGFTEFFVRKLAHISEFAALGFLSTFAFCYTLRNAKRFYLGIAFSLLYAVSDEIHQLYVPGRSGQVRDVFIDLGGILVGAALLGLFYLLYIKLSKRGEKNV